MVEVGDPAPNFTVPLADGDISTFRLNDHLEEGPLVFVFFPAAFSSTCRSELQTFDDRYQEFEAIGATVYGISVDSPYALNAFREREDLSLPLLSDFNHDIVPMYDVETTLESPALAGVADRAVIIVDENGRVALRWEADDPGLEPDYDTVLDAAHTASMSGPEGINRVGDDEPI